MDKFQELDKEYHFNLYGRYPITMSHGKGSRLWDVDGKEYVDGLSGIAVCSLGHSHPKVVDAITKQASKLMHVSNFFVTEPLAELSKAICEFSGMDKVFFCNSGAEATEGAVKVARKYNSLNGKKGCDIISMENSFHGRTIATIAMGKKKYQEGFAPMPSGFIKSNLNDIEDLKSKITSNTGAIIIETIQGEGGVIVVELEYLKAVRKLCDENNILLIADEVQCGVGRTGYFYAFQEYGIKPDIVCSAKGVAAGFPMGTVLATKKVAASMEPGNHGTTFGGNPLACATSLATLNIVSQKEFLNEVIEKGDYFKNELNEKLKEFPIFKEVRGKGLMIGVEFTELTRPIVMKMLDKGVIVNATADTVIRIVPPLIITKEEIDIIVEKLVESIKELF
jgi:acetylornithine/N-succinyldiaminopimelate aminotransferase